ncbi:MAG: cupin domain-containing protein [Candidatus Thorarchaeota archaeon]
MKIYRRKDADTAARAGYHATYIADIEFPDHIGTAGVILVDVLKATKTSPHSHTMLDEAFIFLNRTRMGVGQDIFEIETGDVVIVEKGEKHWFESYPDEDIRIIAVKLPNLKDDKIE